MVALVAVLYPLFLPFSSLLLSVVLDVVLLNLYSIIVTYQHKLLEDDGHQEDSWEDCG